MPVSHVLRKLGLADNVDQLLVVLGLFYPVDKELRHLRRAGRSYGLSQKPHCLQLFGIEQKFLFSRTRLIDLKSGEDPFFCQLSIEVQFHVAGSLELLEDYLIHTAARINKRRSYYGKTAALLDVSSSAKESLGMMQGRRVDTARKGAP